MNRTVASVVALALSLTAASPIKAGDIDASLAEVLSNLNPGQKVRVQVHPLTTLTGQFRGVVGDSLMVLDRGGEHRVAQRDVAALWQGVSDGERWGKGGLAAGAVLGLAVGTFVGAAVASWGDDDRILLSGMASGTGFGAAAGLVLGGVYGSLTTDWRLEYSEPSYHPALWSNAALGRSPSGAISTVSPSPSLADEPRRFGLSLCPTPKGGLLLAASMRF